MSAGLPASRPGDRVVLALCGLQAVALAFTSFYLPVHLREELSFSGTAIGVLYAVYSVTAILAAFPIGLSADRSAPRRLLYLSLVCLAVGAAGLAGLSAFGLVLAAFLALGLSANIFRQVLDALWYRHTDGGGSFSRRFGPFLAVRMGGMAIGMPLCGLLYHALGFRPALAILAAGAVPLALLVRGVPEVALNHAPISRYLLDFARPRVLFFSAWLFVFTSHWGAETTHYGLFLRVDLGLSLSQMGLYMGGELVALGATTWLMGRYAPANSARWLVLGLLLSGVTSVAMLLQPPLLSFAFRFVHGIGDGIVILAVYVAVGDLFRLERIGGSAGLVLLVTMLGGAAGALAYGPLGDTGGHGLPQAISGFITIALAPLVLLVTGRRRRQPA